MQFVDELSRGFWPKYKQLQSTAPWTTVVQLLIVSGLLIDVDTTEASVVYVAQNDRLETCRELETC